MGRTCSAYGERRSIYRVLVGKPEGKRPLGRQGVGGRIILRWKWDVGGMDWIKLAQDMHRWWALVNVAMDLQVPSNAGNFLTS